MIKLKVGYTWRGKSDEATISHYCPTCRSSMDLTREMISVMQRQESTVSICCSEACADAYKAKLNAVDRQMVKIFERGHTWPRDLWGLPSRDAIKTQAMNELLNIE